MTKKDKKSKKIFDFKTDKGIKYKVYRKVIPKREQASGLCSNPYIGSPWIHIDKNLDDKRDLEVIIEEVYHAFNWTDTEKRARKFSATLAKFLYKEGWRKK